MVAVTRRTASVKSAGMEDQYDLARFVTAQEPVYQQVRAELAAGKKRSHWMWFIFPQLRELGRSSTARHFGIGSVEEATAFWEHPVLGGRLRECTELMLAVEGKSALAILGSPDDLKFCSCMTLFEAAATREAVFGQALEKFYAGKRDGATLQLLG